MHPCMKTDSVLRDAAVVTVYSLPCTTAVARQTFELGTTSTSSFDVLSETTSPGYLYTDVPFVFAAIPLHSGIFASTLIGL